MTILWPSVLAGMLITGAPLGLALFLVSRRHGCPVA